MTYEYYVFTMTMVSRHLTLDEAIKKYYELGTDWYKALGIQKDDLYCCDLLNNKKNPFKNQISEDYKKSSTFKDDLIAKNTIELLEHEFNLLKKVI